MRIGGGPAPWPVGWSTALPGRASHRTRQERMRGKTLGFLGHRDIRQTCNPLPLAAGADWLKAARVASEAIFHAVEDEERTSLEGTPSVLNELIYRQFKAPRLDPSTPLVRNSITNLNCIHLVRSPPQIACLLQVPYELNERFDSPRAIDIEQPSEELLKRLLAPPLFHCRAKGKEPPQFFSLPEFDFWQSIWPLPDSWPRSGAAWSPTP